MNHRKNKFATLASGLYLVNRVVFKVLTDLVTPIYAQNAAFRFSLKDLSAGWVLSKNLDAANGAEVGGTLFARH